MFEDDYGYAYSDRPQVSVAERRRQAERELAALQKKGQTASPVVIGNSKIATTFWGRSWCENLERYSDYSTRLPRGRAYVRSGAVVDLQIEEGEVRAKVSGSSLYKVTVRVKPIAAAPWQSICRDCRGGIDSLPALLKGRFAPTALQRVCQQGTGLFPSPREIALECSCPEHSSMCKHVAAVLYGIGARLDASPELLFRLRQVDATELVENAGAATPPAAGAAAAVTGPETTVATPALAPAAEKPERALSPAPKGSSPRSDEPAPARQPAATRASDRRPAKSTRPSQPPSRKPSARAPKSKGATSASRAAKASKKLGRRKA